MCSDLWQLSVSHMQKGLGLGDKTGRALWEACRGIDKRPVQVSEEVRSHRFNTQRRRDLNWVKQLSGTLACFAGCFDARVGSREAFSGGEGILCRLVVLVSRPWRGWAVWKCSMVAAALSVPVPACNFLY